jgi:hypothetical protein
MEWFIGIYVAIGLYKVWGKLLADPSDKPIWMYAQRNTVLWGLNFVLYVLIWPLAKG